MINPKLEHALWPFNLLLSYVFRLGTNSRESHINTANDLSMSGAKLGPGGRRDILIEELGGKFIAGSLKS